MFKPPCLCTNKPGVRCDATHCDMIRLGEAYDIKTMCRPCWLYHHDEAHNRAWGGDGKVTLAPGLLLQAIAPVPSRSPLPCVHLGPATGEMVECPTCSGTVRLKVFGCSVHSRAVLGATRPHMPRGCLDCPDRSVAAHTPNAGQTRHLLFHLYPFRAGEPVWRWHAEQLRRHVGLFNGRRILALALDGQTSQAAVVREAFAGIFDEVIEVVNDPALREVATFAELFSRVQSMDPSDAILYAHGKGVTRYGNLAARRWTELLYEMNVERWAEAQGLLQRHPVVGSFKKIGQGWPSEESLSDWHYSGSWFWVRSRDLFGQMDWRKIDKIWAGIETYPSLHFSREQAGCLFYEFPVDPLKQLHGGAYWRQTVEPAYQHWRAKRVKLPEPIEGLHVEIGGGEYPRGGDWIDCDRNTGVDLEIDRLPFDDDSVAAVYSSHCFEHIRNLHHLLHEIARVCKVGANVEIRVPHWLSPMALCHDHKQVIPPEQVEHWCETALDYWWKGSKKRFRHVKTEQVPSGDFAEARRLHPHMTDEQVMTWVPGAGHEVRYTMEVIGYEG